MARVIRTFTAKVESRTSVARLIEEKGARSVAQRLFRAGEESQNRCNELTHQFEQRYDDRRRTPGSPELADSIEVRYTGLQQARIQGIGYQLRTRAPAFWYLEYGTPAHEIKPQPGKRLAWPGTLLPIDFVVQHPGSTRFRGMFRRVIARALRDRFPGINVPIIE